MFTGLVHGQGEVLALAPHGGQTRLTVRAQYDLAGLCRGESIAVNGVCLTVENFTSREFTAYASAETLRCTNLGALRRGALVNMERALAVGDRLGGHIVSGHVDCVAEVAQVREAGQSRCIRVVFPSEYASEVLPKGSVTLDGISLTINACCGVGEGGWLEVNVIPETWRVTTVGQWRSGTRINMETDMVGKYVRRMLLPWKDGQGGGERQGGVGQDSSRQDSSGQGGVSEAFLQQHGFI